jgi:hypothetical protein
LKSRPNYSKNTCTLTISSKDAVAGEMLWKNCGAKDLIVTVKCFQNKKEKGFKNKEMKEKCSEEN